MLSFKVSAETVRSALLEVSQRARGHGGGWRVAVCDGCRVVATRGPGDRRWTHAAGTAAPGDEGGPAPERRAPIRRPLRVHDVAEAAPTPETPAARPMSTALLIEWAIAARRRSAATRDEVRTRLAAIRQQRAERRRSLDACRREAARAAELHAEITRSLRRA